MGRGRKRVGGCESRLRVGSTFRLRKKLSFQTFFRPPVVEGEVVQKEKKLARRNKRYFAYLKNGLWAHCLQTIKQTTSKLKEKN